MTQAYRIRKDRPDKVKESLGQYLCGDGPQEEDAVDHAEKDDTEAF